MKQKLLLLIIILTCLTGCVPYIETKPDGTTTVSSYALRGTTTKSDGTRTDWNVTPEIPERWFSNVPKYLIDNFSSITESIAKLRPPTPSLPPSPPLTPAPVPVPVTPPPPPIPTPYPTPCPPEPVTPTPIPVPSTVFTLTNKVFMLDMNTLPTSMRKAGFNITDNGLYYAMAFIYAYGPGQTMPDDEAGSLVPLNTPEIRTAIHKWFDTAVLSIAASLRADPSLSVVAISNDGRDRCGFRLGPAIVQRLNEFGGRVTLGKVTPVSEY